MKKFLSVLLTIVLLLSVMPVGVFNLTASAQTISLQGEIYNGEVTITGCNDVSGEIVIPSNIDGYKIVAIGSYAFENCDNITSITIGDGIKSIEDFAFYGSDNLKKVIVPNSVTNIKTGAFFFCKSLEEIIVTEGNQYYSSFEGVLFNKNKTELISYPENKKGDSYSIPNTVTTIKSVAFACCQNLTSVTFDYKITKIEEGAFDGCDKLSEVKYKGTQEQKNKIVIEDFNSKLTEADWHYFDNEFIINYDANGGKNAPSPQVKTIGIDIKLSTDKPTREGYTFIGWSNHVLGKKLYDVGSKYSADENITLIALWLKNCEACEGKGTQPTTTCFNCYGKGHTLNGIACISCGKYSVIYRKERKEFVCTSCLTNNLYAERHICIVCDGDGLTETCSVCKGNPLYKCENTLDIAAPQLIEKVCGKVELKKLDYVEYSIDGTTWQDSNVFNNLAVGSNYVVFQRYKETTYLKSSNMSFPLQVYIEPHVYSDVCDGSCNLCGKDRNPPHEYKNSDELFCNKCEAVRYLNYRYYSTGVAIASYDGNMKNLVIPSSIEGYPVIRIDSNAFFGCSSLKSVTIPDSVKSIGIGAFKGCDNLEKISVPFVGAQYNGTENTHFGYIFGAQTIYDGTLNGYYIGGNKRFVPPSLKTAIITGGNLIDDRAFYECVSLENVYITGNVRTIGKRAFEWCTNLKELYVSSDTSEFGILFLDKCNLVTLYGTKGSKIEDEAYYANIEYKNICEFKNDNMVLNHSYSNGCDTICNICDNVREAPDHVYDNDCDNACNICNITRTITHDYKTATCKAPKTCKICGATSGSKLAHTYTNTCDAECNVCKAKRKISHNYKYKSTIENEIFIRNNNIYKCTKCSKTISIHGLVDKTLKGKSIYSKSATVTGVKNKTYTGKAITQSIKVKYNGKTLKKGKDYTVTYRENKAVGHAYLEIKGKGNYVGVLREWFDILPKTTTLKTAKSTKKGQMTLKWNKTSKADTTKYQIVYSTNSKFSKGKKVVYASANSTSKIIKGLKSKKTYYVKVRKVKTLVGYYGGDKMYGKYSAVKKVKIK